MAARATAPLEQEEDAAERSQSPNANGVASGFAITLDSIPQFGATFYGVGVRSVKMELADGRVQRLELPCVEIDGDELGSRLTPKQSAILTVIDEMKVGDVLGYEGIAAKAGYSASLDLREFVQQLAMTGRLAKDRQGWKRVR